MYMNKIHNIIVFNEKNIPTAPRANGIYKYYRIAGNDIVYSYHNKMIKLYNFFLNTKRFGLQLNYKRK